MVTSSTIDKIKDTTIMRMIRKMAGVIDEQNEVVESVQTQLDNFNVDNIQTQLDKNTGDITNLTTSVTKVEDDIVDIKGDINEINGIDNVQNGNITKNTTDISQLKISDTEHTTQISTLDTTVDNHAREITAIKAKAVSQDAKIDNLNTITDALTKELPTEIALYRDGTGKIRAQVTQEDETTFDSNVLDMIIPYQYDIIAGTTARSFKLQITMSNGDKVTTNDFLIPEGGGTDVTVTGVTLTKDSSNSNKIKVSINLSDGTPLESGYIGMVTAVSGSYANKKLTITVNGVSSVPITIDTSYTQGTGITISGGTISIDSTVVALKSEISDMETKTNANATFAKKTDISDMETKTNANATYATKSTVTQIQNAVGDCFNAVGLGSDGKSLDFTAVDGQVNNIAIPSSGGSFSNTSFTTFYDIDQSKLQIGSIIFFSYAQGGAPPKIDYSFIGLCTSQNPISDYYIYGSGIYHDYDSSGTTTKIISYVFNNIEDSILTFYFTDGTKITDDNRNTKNIKVIF